MPSSEKNNYGPLGELTRAEWKKFLDSDKGLFKKIAEEPPVFISGPILNTNGKVEKDQLFFETSYFTYKVSKEQTDFYIELLSYNSSAAREYLFTVSLLKERWKENMRWLEVALFYLQEEDQLLHRDEQLLQEKGPALSIHFPEALKRHHPQLFQDIEFAGLSAQETLEKIKEVLKKTVPEEEYLKDYLGWAKEEMPFLFEDF